MLGHTRIVCQVSISWVYLGKVLVWGLVVLCPIRQWTALVKSERLVWKLWIRVLIKSANAEMSSSLWSYKLVYHFILTYISNRQVENNSFFNSAWFNVSLFYCNVKQTDKCPWLIIKSTQTIYIWKNLFCVLSPYRPYTRYMFLIAYE